MVADSCGVPYNALIEMYFNNLFSLEHSELENNKKKTKKNRLSALL